MKVLFVTSTIGNGGIQSWAKNYIKACHGCELRHLQILKRRSLVRNEPKIPIKRVKDGLLDMFDMFRDINRVLDEDKNIDVIHYTTSGSFSTIRDYFTAKIAHRYGTKIIMHCHYGCIPNDYTKSGFWGWMFRKTLPLYDQIWVLDSHSLETLDANPLLNGKIRLTPNFLDVPEITIIPPKEYKDIAFVGNLNPSKGLFELVSAVASLTNDTRLTIVGPGKPFIIDRIKDIAGEKFGKEIRLLGQLSNEDAVKVVGKMDIIALPTYYRAEAFPISILEAMSRGKMVISTPRAAIPDMLTDLDGNLCGKLVAEGSYMDVAKAILWCQSNKTEADIMCQKAYEKVKNAYSTKTILDLYLKCYKDLVEN